MSSVAVPFPAVLPSFSAETETLEAKRVRAVGSFSSSVRTASTLEVRPAPTMIPFGIPSLDEFTGGVPRGALTELVGPVSSGRSSVTLSLIASVTRRQEVCALVDVTDSFDPISAEAAGVDLERLLWVRCGKERSQASGVGSQQVAVRKIAGPRTIGSVAPPAKNISWSIHQNYDARLRHAITGGCYAMTRGRSAPSFEFPVSGSEKKMPGRTSSPVQAERSSADEPIATIPPCPSSAWQPGSPAAFTPAFRLSGW